MAARTPAYYMTFVIENGCPYCQQEQPIIAAFQKTHPTIEVTTINISTDPAFVQKENIKLTPTMIIYKEGKEIARLENVQPLDALNSTLK
jgi:thiol-disulfide isomerase/thioredoxin